MLLKNILSSFEKDLINTSVRKDVFCNEEGWIEKIHTRELGLILIELGGGRKQVTDKIDYGVGYDNVLNIGDEVNSTTPLLSLYSNKNIDDNLINKIQSCFIISDKKTQKLSEIFEDIKKDLKTYSLELRIQELESKFAEDLSETTFNELKDLKNERKTN